jgi:hypothetical protein
MIQKIVAWIVIGITLGVASYFIHAALLNTLKPKLSGQVDPMDLTLTYCESCKKLTSVNEGDIDFGLCTSEIL